MSERTVLIVDDQPDMRRILTKITEKAPGFTVVGESGDGEQAVALYEELRPDVVFLDIEMPGISGMDCARRIIDINPRVCLIFATAHEQYMKDAFELYAFDYLLKPFDIERALETFRRIAQTLSRSQESPAAPAQPSAPGLNKLMIRHREGVSLVDMADIILVQREERSTVIYTADERIVTSETLSDLHKRLDPALFFRSHKSYIINLAMVYKIFPYGRWTYVVKLRNLRQDALVTYDKMTEMEKVFK